VGYETYIKRAERSGRLSGWNVTTDGKLDDGSLRAIITIHRNDFTHPFVHEVFYSEYVQRTKEGRPTKFWADKPYTMIKKVAMAQGFRLCFSDELGGMPYTADELPDQVGQNQIVIESADLSEVKTQLESCNEMDCLAQIWKDNQPLHSNNEFKELVKVRKEQIASTPKKDDYQKTVITMIEEAQSPEEIVGLLKDETDPVLLEAGMKQIELFTNSNQ
jgi:hypothetical protein